MFDNEAILRADKKKDSSNFKFFILDRYLKFLISDF